MKNIHPTFLRMIPWTIAFVILYAYRFIYSFDRTVLTTIVLTFIDLIFLYLSAVAMNRLLIPRLLYRKKIVAFAACVIPLGLIQCLIVMAAQEQWYRISNTLPEGAQAVLNTFTYQVFNTGIIAFLGYVCICFFRVVTDHYFAQKKYEVLLREKAEAELSFLKAQVNPHFLFNSINSIYGSIDRHNTLARNTLVKFSEMLRYQLYECNADRISVDKEVQYLLNYSELQQLRMDNLVLKLDIGREVTGFEIAPLLFIPLVENAFKYTGNDERSHNEIEMSLHKEHNVLSFCVRNTKNVDGTKSVFESRGIGLHNVKRRLELLYPGTYSLDIENMEKYFTVNLKIKVYGTKMPGG